MTHNVLLSNLTNSTLYYYNITSCDVYGNCAVYGTYNFTTLSFNPINVSINSSEWDSNSTNLSAMNNSQLANITNLTFSNSRGKISFIQNISIVRDVNLTGNVVVSNMSIFINSTALPMFNAPATLIFSGVSLSHPIVKHDGSDCGSYCNGTSYNSTTSTFVANVTGFSNYSLVEQCSDGIRNYDETGVDCGGSCSACVAAPAGNQGSGLGGAPGNVTNTTGNSTNTTVNATNTTDSINPANVTNTTANLTQTSETEINETAFNFIQFGNIIDSVRDYLVDAYNRRDPGFLLIPVDLVMVIIVFMAVLRKVFRKKAGRAAKDEPPKIEAEAVQKTEPPEKAVQQKVAMVNITEPPVKKAPAEAVPKTIAPKPKVKVAAPAARPKPVAAKQRIWRPPKDITAKPEPKKKVKKKKKPEARKRVASQKLLKELYSQQ
jgi:hypothetical protein